MLQHRLEFYNYAALGSCSSWHALTYIYLHEANLGVKGDYASLHLDDLRWPTVRRRYKTFANYTWLPIVSSCQAHTMHDGVRVLMHEADAMARVYAYIADICKIRNSPTCRRAPSASSVCSRRKNEAAAEIVAQVSGSRRKVGGLLLYCALTTTSTTMKAMPALPVKFNRRDTRAQSIPVQVSKAGALAPEIVFMILNHVRHPRDTLPDPPHVLPTLRALPLVCKAWYQPSIEILYQRIIFSSRSSRQAKLLIRSICRNPTLGLFVNVLCFPDLRFRPCDYYRNERSTVRLRNYANLISICPNIIFLRLPSNLQNALSPRDVPGLPLSTVHTLNLLSLHLTTHPGSTRFSSDSQARTNATLSFLPIHTSFPCLVHLTLANFTFNLESLPNNSRLLFPYLPSLRSLTLTSCILDERSATQIFNSLRGSLKYLELWQSGYLPELTETAFRILGPTLEGLVIDEFLYEYHVMLDGPSSFGLALPSLRSLKITAEKLSVEELRRLPPTLEKLKITALPMCPCSACAKGENWSTQAEADGLQSASVRSPEMSKALALALVHEAFDVKHLKEIILSGRCCAWHKWDTVLAERCLNRGIRLVKEMVPGSSTRGSSHLVRSLAR